MAVHYVCKTIILSQGILGPKEVRGRYVILPCYHSFSQMSYNTCIEHTIHLMATHFIKALCIPSLSKTKNQIDAEDDFNVDVSIDIEASTDDAEAI